MKSMKIAAVVVAAGIVGYGLAAQAQPATAKADPVKAKADPVKVDSKHYAVEFENESVHVLRISYGPGEKSVMHSHPNAVAVYLTDGKTRMTTPDGKSEEMPVKAGAAAWAPSGSHLPENVGGKPFQVILVELKK